MQEIQKKSSRENEAKCKLNEIQSHVHLLTESTHYRGRAVKPPAIIICWELNELLDNVSLLIKGLIFCEICVCGGDELRRIPAGKNELAYGKLYFLHIVRTHKSTCYILALTELL